MWCRVAVDEEYSGIVMEKLQQRKATLQEFTEVGGKTRLIFLAPSRGLIGCVHTAAAVRVSRYAPLVTCRRRAGSNPSSRPTLVAQVCSTECSITTAPSRTSLTSPARVP